MLVTTYDFVMRDKGSLSKIVWQYLIIDEGHRIKNKDSKLTTVLAKDYKGMYGQDRLRFVHVLLQLEQI